MSAEFSPQAWSPIQQSASPQAWSPSLGRSIAEASSIRMSPIVMPSSRRSVSMEPLNLSPRINMEPISAVPKSARVSGRERKPKTFRNIGYSPIKIRVGPKTAKKSSRRNAVSMRKPPQSAARLEEELHKKRVTQKRRLSLAEGEEAGLTQMAKWVFGEDVQEKLQRVACSDVDNTIKKDKIRKIWELSTPTTQCHNVIGPVHGNTECWICGLGIVSNENFLRIMNPKGLALKVEQQKDLLKTNGMSAQCEHILPIVEAVIYLKLYNSDHKGAITSRHAVEYGWAHATCNYEKNDLSALIFGHNITINRRKIQHLLEKIYNSTRKDSIILKGLLRNEYRSVKNFVDARLPAMIAKYQQIIDVLTHTSIENRNNAIGLLTLAGVSLAGETNRVNPKFHCILPVTRAKPSLSRSLSLESVGSEQGTAGAHALTAFRFGTNKPRASPLRLRTVDENNTHINE